MIDKILTHPIYTLFAANRRYFLWVTLAALVLGGVMLYIVPKQYSSSTLLFPAQNFSPSKVAVEADAGNQDDYMIFGFDDDCERLIDLLNSDGLKREMADVFN